jgi:hypothetical protein
MLGYFLKLLHQSNYILEKIYSWYIITLLRVSALTVRHKVVVDDGISVPKHVAREYLLSSASVGSCNSYNNMHGMNNLNTILCS